MSVDVLSISGPRAERRQRHGGPRDQVDPAQLRPDLDGPVAVGEAGSQGRPDLGVAAGAGVHDETEGDLRVADRHHHGVAGRPDAEEAREVADPCLALGCDGGQVVEPGGQGGDALVGQRGDGEVGDRVASHEPEHPAEGVQGGAGSAVELGADQGEDEVQNRVVELVGAIGTDPYVAGNGRPGQLEPPEQQRERRVAIAGCGGDVELQADRPDAGDAGSGGIRRDGDGRGHPDPAADGAEQERARHGVVVLRSAEQRHLQRRGRPWVGGAHGDAQTQRDVVVGRVVDGDRHVERRARDAAVDYGQPGGTARVGGALLATERVVDEADQGVALSVDGQHRAEVVLGVAEPVRVGVAVEEEAQRGGEVLERAEIDTHAAQVTLWPPAAGRSSRRSGAFPSA